MGSGGAAGWEGEGGGAGTQGEQKTEQRVGKGAQSASWGGYGGSRKQGSRLGRGRGLGWHSRWVWMNRKQSSRSHGPDRPLGRPWREQEAEQQARQGKEVGAALREAVGVQHVGKGTGVVFWEEHKAEQQIGWHLGRAQDKCVPCLAEKVSPPAGLRP